MAKLEIKLIIGEGSGNILTFDETQVLDWSTKTFCTSDASLPIFDMFPNSGSVVIKDSNLSLYNQAISGMFDNNYNYELNIYVDGEKIAHHLVNEQPKYSYEEKTLTLYLGNELDIANDLIYEGYTYPLEEQTFLTIFKNVITSLFNITSDKLNALLSKQYSVSTSDGEQTFNDYFATIKVPYPYVSSKSYREVLRNLLTIAKCCLYEDENKDLVLVRMDGGFAESVDTTTPSANIYNSVNFVLSSQTSVGFVPSVIQQNNYNVAEIGCNKIDIVSNKDIGFKDYFNPIEEVTNILSYAEHDYTVSGSSYITLKEIPQDQRNNCSFFSSITNSGVGSLALLLGINYKTTSFTIEVPKKINMNLTEILSISDFTYLLFTGEFEETINVGNMQFITDLDDAANGAVITNYNIDKQSTKSSVTKNINNYNLKNNLFYFNFTPQYGYNTKEKTILYSFPKIEPVFEITETTDDKFVIKCSNVITGYTYMSIEKTEVSHTSEYVHNLIRYIDSIEYKETTIKTNKLQISFLGETYDIEFNGKTLTAPSNVSPAHKMTIENGGGLMQYTGDISETSFPVQYALDLLGWHNGGIRTGQLSVIKDVYTNYSSGMPTFNRFVLYAGKSQSYVLNGIKSFGYYRLVTELGDVGTQFQHLIYNNAEIEVQSELPTTRLTTLKIEIEDNKITITNTGNYDAYIVSISRHNTQASVGQANHKVFKCGDLIVPCKDYQYTPIMTNSSDEPIIYQVVEAETFGEGGAVFQTLQVREVKGRKASELPYYLVANESGITICIKDNGYATEGTNNEIIQIGWQT